MQQRSLARYQAQLEYAQLQACTEPEKVIYLTEYC